MNWYKYSMPQIKDVKSSVDQICMKIKQIQGVKDVFLFGSYAANINNPSAIVKDVDIIAVTEFNTGDLLAIDNTAYSALKISPKNLEEEGFCKEAVSFTKQFLSYGNYNIDHWALSASKQLLHWGDMPETKEEWQEIHIKAEQEANVLTGISKNDLKTATNAQKKEWKEIFDKYINRYVQNKNSGWCLSENKFNSIKKDIIKWTIWQNN